MFNRMVDRASATVQMDEKGRVTIPKSTRKALEVEGKRSDLDLDIEVLARHPDSGEER